MPILDTQILACIIVMQMAFSAVYASKTLLGVTASIPPPFNATIHITLNPTQPSPVTSHKRIHVTMPSVVANTKYAVVIGERGVGGSNGFAKLDCAAAGGVFDPTNKTKVASYKCDPQKMGDTCAVGDFVGKFGLITGDASHRVNTSWVDTMVSFQGVDSIIGKSIIVFKSASQNILEVVKGERVACATLVPIIGPPPILTSPTMKTQATNNATSTSVSSSFGGIGTYKYAIGLMVGVLSYAPLGFCYI